MLGVASLTTVALGAGFVAFGEVVAVEGFVAAALAVAVVLRRVAVELLVDGLLDVVAGFTRVDVPVLRRVLILASIVAL